MMMIKELGHNKNANCNFTSNSKMEIYNNTSTAVGVASNYPILYLQLE